MTSQPHSQDLLFEDPSKVSGWELCRLLDNYVGQTKSMAWDEIVRRCDQLAAACEERDRLGP